MDLLWLRLKAPFAAFRYFQAGVYRASSPIIPHSAAWGLVLNLAGIETRINLSNAITEINPSAPRLRLAVGAVEHGEKCTLYQQLHSYPVGSSGKDYAERTKGSKYWIAPVRREVLAGFDVMVGVQTDTASLLQQVKDGLAGKLPGDRYGVPFAGDNNLFFDDIRVVKSPEPAYWYSRLNTDSPARAGSCRLTIKIDRVNSSKSISLLFAPEQNKTNEPPENSWVWTPDNPERN